MSAVEFDEEAYLAEIATAEIEARDAWLSSASREELVAEIRKLENQLAQTQQEQDETLRPAIQLIDGIGVFKLDRFEKPLSIVQDMIGEIEQHRRRRSMDHRVENFLADYRPDIIAQIVANRRSFMCRADYKWPDQEKAEYLSNPLVRSFFGVRSGYFNFEHTRYWAAVIDAIQDGDFAFADRVDKLKLDLCEKEEREGYLAGRAYLHVCPYEPESLQASMWWHGQRRGQNEYLFDRPSENVNPIE